MARDSKRNRCGTKTDSAQRFLTFGIICWHAPQQNGVTKTMFGFYEFYVHAFGIGIPLLAVAIASMGAFRASLTANQIAVFVTASAVILGAWFAVALPFSRSGVFNVPAEIGDPPYVLMFLFGGATLNWGLAWLTPLGRRITEATSLSAIAAFQIPRIMGGLFLIGWIVGDIPALFALPAGLGDILAGIAGWQASRALAKGEPNARSLLARAIFIGIADFFFAVLFGIITSPGFAHLYALDAPNIINAYPLAMFPAFFVPIFLGFHFIAISRLRQESAMESKAHA
tara:strand:+ start:30565 stop:31419 length:855 start_codon:yes stop_codon:yes gene_type:complete